jgi:hypothetical protein
MAVSITRHPEALVRALTKLHADPQLVVSRNHDLGTLWFEPLQNPDHGQYAKELADYALEDRIARLTAETPRT